MTEREYMLKQTLPSPGAVFEGSNGDATRALYARLEAIGPVGVIALNLFRACKCSGRAKEYSRRYKGEAYGRKEWSLENLCRELAKSGEALGIEWGWKIDPMAPVYRWVLYVVIPTGQVSFHNMRRLADKNFAGEWDGANASPERIVKWTEQVLKEATQTTATHARPENTRIQHQHSAPLETQVAFPAEDSPFD